MPAQRWILKADITPNPDRPAPRKRLRMKIGYGTSFTSEYGGGILATVQGLPLNWNGQLMLVPVASERNDDDETSDVPGEEGVGY